MKSDSNDDGTDVWIVRANQLIQISQLYMNKYKLSK